MSNKTLSLKPAFGFGTLVHTVLDNKEEKTLFKVLSLQINIDSTIAYGCVNEAGEWSWYKAY